MATVLATKKVLSEGQLLTWSPLTHANNAGDKRSVPGGSKTVQVTGTFDGATVLIQGSNDGTTFATLKDPNGNAVSFTAAGLKSIQDDVLWIRPSHSGGTATESLTISVVAFRAPRALITDGSITAKNVASDAFVTVCNPDGTGHYTTIKAAVDAGKRYLLIKGQHTVTVGSSFGDSNYTIAWAPDAKVLLVGAITLFSVPDGLTEERYYHFHTPTVEGDDTAAQTFFKSLDTNSYPVPYIHDPYIEGVNRILHFAAGDETWTRAYRGYIEGGKILPIPSRSDNEFLKMDVAHGNFMFPGGIWITRTMMYDQVDFQNGGWKIDCDGDLILDDVFITLDGHCHIAGGALIGSLNLYSKAFLSDGTDSLEVHGNVWWGTSWWDWVYCIGIALKLDQSWSIVGIYLSKSNLTFNAIGCTVGHVSTAGAAYVPAVGVDVLAGAHDCLIESSVFCDFATAAIRSAATGTRVVGSKFNVVAGKAIVDTGAGDFTLVTGCKGLGAANANCTLAANSKAVVGTGINLA